MTVHQSQVRPFSDVSPLGVVVRSVPPLDPSEHFGLHSGFLYKIDNAEPRINHLAWHYDLRDEPAAEPYLWADVGLDEGNSRFMAAWLADRRASPNNIPYGINSTGACFDKDTKEFIQPPIGKGLTCATYIMAIFFHFGFSLLDETLWPNDRTEDQSWQRAVVDELRRRGAEEAHIEAVNADVGSKRFRPAEVVGAATRPPATWPLPFDDVAAVAQSIIVDVQAAVALVEAPAAALGGHVAMENGD